MESVVLEGAEAVLRNRGPRALSFASQCSVDPHECDRTLSVLMICARTQTEVILVGVAGEIFGDLTGIFRFSAAGPWESLQVRLQQSGLTSTTYTIFPPRSVTAISHSEIPSSGPATAKQLQRPPLRKYQNGAWQPARQGA